MRMLALLILFAACTRAAPDVVRIPEYRVSPACVAQRDSMHADSARLRTQKRLAFLTYFEMRRVATIVARDPSQVRFLIGWTNRAFVGLPMDSAR